MEIFDLDPGSDSVLENISTRGFVDTGDNVMIGGFILSAGTDATVVVRAISSSMSGIVAGTFPDPTLGLYDGSGMQIAFNDDWEGDGEASQIPDQFRTEPLE